MSITAEQRGFANGYAKCFLACGMADNMDLDYDEWVECGDIDFNIHFSEGLVVVDAYIVVNGQTRTDQFTRVFTEGEA
jgi:hypothetical protein